MEKFFTESVLEMPLASFPDALRESAQISHRPQPFRNTRVDAHAPLDDALTPFGEVAFE